MTAQVSEKLINKNSEVDFDGYALYSIGIENPENDANFKPYPFKQKPDPSIPVVFTACWRGHVSVYELESSGELRLIKYEYPFHEPPIEPDTADEILEGNFWLELRTQFFGDQLFVPFENGRIVTDRSKWHEVRRVDSVSSGTKKRRFAGVRGMIKVLSARNQ